MNRILRILCLLVLVACISNLFTNIECRNAKNSRRSDDFDEDEFSEFDNLDEDEKPKKAEQPVPASNTQQASKNKLKQDEADFASFETIDEENEDQDDEFENKPNNQDQQQQQQQKSQQSQQQQQKAPTKKSDSLYGQNNQDDLDMEEFEHFVDDEEFEGFDSKSSKSESSKSKDTKSTNQKPKDSKSDMPNLKIADVPMHLMSNGNWQNYVYEIVMLFVIAVYLVNFLYGKNKNYRLVMAWYASHRDYLEQNFSVVGDDGNSPELPQQRQQQQPQEKSEEESEQESAQVKEPIKESENSYGLWCTGRQSCDGMLVQLKLVKRQDLINGVLMQFIKPQSDQIILSVEYSSRDDLDNFVFCLTNKKLSQQLFNDYQDLASYCSEKKTLPSGGSSNGVSVYSGDYKYADLLSSTVASRYVMLNEFGEVPNQILDTRVCAFLNKYPEMVEYIIVSDQFVGYKVQVNDDQTTTAAGSSQPLSSSDLSPTNSQSLSTNSIGLPKSRPILIICLNIPGKGLNTTTEDMERMHPAIQLATYLIDRVPRIRLSKEAKVKAIKKEKMFLNNL